jgi:cell division protein FtsQ
MLLRGTGLRYSAPRRGATPRGETAHRDSISRARWLVPVVILVLLLAALRMGWSALREVANVPINRIDVKGDFRFLEKQRITQLIDPHVESGYFMVDLTRIRDELKRLPLVQDVTVRRGWPDRIVVFITEQVPVLRYGTDAYLNPYGQAFRTGAQLPGLDLPLVDGPDGTGKLLLTQFDRFGEQLEPTGLRIRVLLLDGKHAWRMTLDNGTEVLIGRRESEARMKTLAALLRGPMAADRDRMARIDLRYSNGVAIAWRNGAVPTPTVATAEEAGAE